MTKSKIQKNIEMKDSGVYWIGDIPSEWNTLKVKFCTKFISGIGFPERLQGNKNREDTPFLKVSDINHSGRFVGVSNNYISIKTILNNKWSTIKKGSIVMAKIGAALAKNHRKIILRDSLIDNNIMAVSPDKLFIENNAFYYYLWSNINLEDFQNISSVPSVNMYKLKNYTIIIPPKEIQAKIVEFLDEKTGAVAEVMAKKKKMVELLKEKRSSVITYAVTKGLDPNVEMKDSGVDWIGDIPSGWNTDRLFALGHFLKGFGIARKDLSDDGVPAVLYGDIYTRYNIKAFDLQRRIPSNIALKSRKVKKGDILFAGSGETKEDIGKNFVYLGDDQAYAGGDILIFRQNKNDSLFLSYALVGETSVAHKESTSTGEIIVHTTASKLKNLKIVIPPMETQEKIVEFLDKKTAEIDSIISKIQKQVKLLDEYKASLIYHAVTGKMSI